MWSLLANWAVAMAREMYDMNRLLTCNKRLKKEKEQAVYASEQKTAFLANMSHELRTPLRMSIAEILTFKMVSYVAAI